MKNGTISSTQIDKFINLQFLTHLPSHIHAVSHKSVFETLNAVDVSDKTKEKNRLKYLPWAAAWAEVKKVYPDASFKVYPQIMDEFNNTRYWHEDGKTGWVEVGVTIEGVEQIETLAIMDFKNTAIPAEKITSVEANKALKRCFVKAIALHGLGLFVYMGEDMPEDTAKILALQDEVVELVQKKYSLSKEAGEKVIGYCKDAEGEANPHFTDDDIKGNPRNIDDLEILEKLKRQLLSIRK